MADIDDPRAIRFANETIRPLAERLRALHYEIDAVMIDWYAGMNALVPNDASPIADGREREGISRLVGSDAVSLIVAASGIKAVLDGEGVAQVVAKPCVRRLRVSAEG